MKNRIRYNEFDRIIKLSVLEIGRTGSSPTSNVNKIDVLPQATH